jgi:hypothetical protein
VCHFVDVVATIVNQQALRYDDSTPHRTTTYHNILSHSHTVFIVTTPHQPQ